MRPERHTDRSGTCVDAVLNEFFADRLQVNNNLPRLYLVHRTALDGLDCGHINPCRDCVEMNDDRGNVITRRVLPQSIDVDR